jgi:hypothetical protein
MGACMKATIEAKWEVSLFAKCPHCKMRQNLVDTPLFFDRHTAVDLLETNTDRSDNVYVICQLCRKAFEVCCVI